MVRSSLIQQPVAAVHRGNGHAADGLCLHIPRSAFTHAGFRAWVKSDDFPEKVRATFVEQEIIIDMSNEEIETHVMVKGEVSRVLMNLNVELDLGRFYADGALISNVAAEVSNDPDAVFHTWSSLDRGRVRLVPRAGEAGQFLEIEGSPDWVLEVVSDSSVTKDTRKLLAAYHRAGIREYWLIDARGADIDFRILHWRKSGYKAAADENGWQRSRVFGRSFRLVREAARRGLWKYTLMVRSE